MNKTLEESHTLDVLTTSEAARLTELEAQIDGHKIAVLQTAYALREIQQQRLYRASHPTFEAYMQERHGWTRQSGYRLISWVEIIENVSPEGYTPSRAEARVLEPLTAEEQRLLVRMAQIQTGQTNPSSAALKSLVDTMRGLQEGMVEHPQTGEQMPIGEVPREQLAQVVKSQVERGRGDLVRYQGQVGTEYWLRQHLEENPHLQAEWVLTVTDKTTGEQTTVTGKTSRQCCESLARRLEEV